MEKARSDSTGTTPEPESQEGKNLRQTLHDYQIEPGDAMSDEARRQLEQNIIPQENYP